MPNEFDFGESTCSSLARCRQTEQARSEYRQRRGLRDRGRAVEIHSAGEIDAALNWRSAKRWSKSARCQQNRECRTRPHFHIASCACFFAEDFPVAPIALRNGLRICGEIRTVFAGCSLELVRHCNDVSPERFIRGRRERLGAIGRDTGSGAVSSQTGLLRRFGGNVTATNRWAVSPAFSKFVPSIILSSDSENTCLVAVSHGKISRGWFR